MRQKLNIIWNWIKANKIASFAIVLIIVLAFVVLFFKPKKDSGIIAPLPTSTSAFILTSTTPANSGIMTSPWSTEPVVFNFNKPIKKETILYQVSPQTQLKVIYQDHLPGQFSIVPLTGWKDKTEYTISIRKSLTSESGIQLGEDITLKFKREVNFDQYPVEQGESYPD